MIFVLSPSKALDETSPLPAHALELATNARFLEQAAILIKHLERFKPTTLGDLMEL